MFSPHGVLEMWRMWQIHLAQKLNSKIFNLTPFCCTNDFDLNRWHVINTYAYASKRKSINNHYGLASFLTMTCIYVVSYISLNVSLRYKMAYKMKTIYLINIKITTPWIVIVKPSWKSLFFGCFKMSCIKLISVRCTYQVFEIKQSS